MTTKKEKLILLKQKVTNMQNDLKVLESKSGQLTAPTDFTKPIHKITNSKGKRLFCQTQREITFQFRDNNTFFNKKVSKGEVERSNTKEKTQRNLSPTLKEILNTMDNKFYHKKPIPLIEKDQITSASTERLYQTSFIGRRYAFNDFGLTRGESSKESKLKTFPIKKTDLIVNPERQKEVGKKIVNKLLRSPVRMLTQNPRSNPKLYFMTDKAIFLQNKGLVANKNKSSLIFSPSKGEIMPKKNANSLQKKIRSQKKHFQQYKHEFYATQPNLKF